MWGQWWGSGSCVAGGCGDSGSGGGVVGVVVVVVGIEVSVP